MLRLKFLARLICFGAVSGAASAAYQESIYLPGSSDYSHFSYTPSAITVIQEKNIEHPNSSSGASSYSVIRGEVNASPLPFVSTSSTSHVQTGEYGYQSNYGFLNFLSSQINYDFTINGTPNSIIPISMKSIVRFEASDNIQSNIFDGVSYTNGRAGPSSTASLSVYITNHAVEAKDYPYAGFDFEGICGDVCIQRVTNPNYELNPFAVPVSVNGQQLLLNDSNSAYAYNSYVGEDRNQVFGGPVNSWMDEYLLESVFKIQLDDQGTSNGFVSMSSTSLSSAEAFTVGAIFEGSQSVYSSSSSYIDPFFSIDPAYLNLNPNASLSFTPGVGNANLVSSVPVPAAVWLFASGLPVLFRLKRSNKDLVA